MSHLYSDKQCSECETVGDALVFEDGFICVECYDKPAKVDPHKQWHDSVLRIRDRILERDNRLELSALNCFDPND